MHNTRGVCLFMRARVCLSAHTRVCPDLCTYVCLSGSTPSCQQLSSRQACNGLAAATQQLPRASSRATDGLRLTRQRREASRSWRHRPQDRRQLPRSFLHFLLEASSDAPAATQAAQLRGSCLKNDHMAISLATHRASVPLTDEAASAVADYIRPRRQQRDIILKFWFLISFCIAFFRIAF